MAADGSKATPHAPGRAYVCVCECECECVCVGSQGVGREGVVVGTARESCHVPRAVEAASM